MKVLKRTKITFQNGKELKRESSKGRGILDSVAEDLIINGEILIKEAKKSKEIKIVSVWIEDKEATAVNEKANQKGGANEANEFDVETAKGDDLKAYAAENNIDLGEATKVADIREIIIEALK